MTSRILAAFLGLTALLLLGALVPLGFAMSQQHAQDFRSRTLDIARSLAATSEESIENRERAAGVLARALATLRRETEDGEHLVLEVVNRNDQVVVGADTGRYTPERMAEAMAGETRVSHLEDRLLAVVPIGDPGERVKGVVLLARPLSPLHRRVGLLWMRLGVVAFAAVTVAVVLAVYLAQWVGRPLRRLELAAESLGAGELAARAAPPRRPEEVRRLAERFNVMAARLETLIYDSRMVLADVSHQLRTPLAALRLRMELFAEEARSGGSESDAAEFDAALEELSRLARLVDGLLAVARAENTTTPAEEVPVSDVLAERADAWAPVAAERDVRLSVDAPDHVVALAAPGHLEQALDNLIDNALTAAPREGRVRMSARRVEHRIRITVADDGPGMPPEAMAEAFRRFRTGRAGGTGLGLPIVHRLITADGGEVTLSSTPGGGLTVTLELPASH